MNYLDIYYRALVDYRKNTASDHDCTGQRQTTSKANAKTDEVVVTRQVCDIETDWIEAIEKGLVHVDKAIREDRQFIRSNGEVIDIEKVKNVSKDSVEHLARHSNLITRFNEEEDIIPDRLYTVERLSDYAVYENKFLYMLLCYLRDFITVRYNKILDLEHTYNGELSMDKNIVMPKRKIDFKISLKEERKDDPYLSRHSKSHVTINRIRDILELTHSFLATPLMQEVAKVPMLKPPVTKTNVLRMNHNFRGALALYEYITAYDKDGYTVNNVVQKTSPFKIDMADEFSEIVLLSSFLTYEYGLNIKEELRDEYNREEERRKAEEIKRQLDQIKSLRRRIKESGQSPEEYMLALEKVNRALEQDSQKLAAAKMQIDELNDAILDLKTQIDILNQKIVGLNQEIERTNNEFAEKLVQLAEEHKQELEKLSESYENQISEINEAHSDELKRICEEHSDEIARITGECEDRVNEILCKIEEERVAHESALEKVKDKHKADLESLSVAHENQISEIKAEWHNEAGRLYNVCSAHEQKIAELETEKEKLIEARRLAEARLIAIRQEKGMKSPAFDFTTEESFQELENQLDVFERFFFDEWKKTKKSIRKNVIKDFFTNIKRAKIRRRTKQGRAEQKEKMLANRNEKQVASGKAQEPKKAEKPQKTEKTVAPKNELQAAPIENESKVLNEINVQAPKPNTDVIDAQAQNPIEEASSVQASIPNDEAINNTQQSNEEAVNQQKNTEGNEG